MRLLCRSKGDGSGGDTGNAGNCAEGYSRGGRADSLHIDDWKSIYTCTNGPNVLHIIWGLMISVIFWDRDEQLYTIK